MSVVESSGSIPVSATKELRELRNLFLLHRTEVINTRTQPGGLAQHLVNQAAVEMSAIVTIRSCTDFCKGQGSLSADSKS